MSNPFFYGGRIENPNDFIGRKAELRVIFSALETFSAGQAQHISIVGERRIGKSSLLYNIIQTYQQRLNQPDCYRFIFVDLEGPNSHSLHGLLGFILKNLNLPASNHPSLSEFADALEKLHDKRKICPVICLDEFEQLVNHKDEFPNSVYETFRSLGSNNKVAFLTASKTPLFELIQQSNMTSTFPNIFRQKQLGVFNPAEARQLLDRCYPPFSQTEKERFLRVTKCNPGELQMIANTAYNNREDGIINWEVIKKSHEQQLEYVNAHHRNPERKNILTEIFRGIFVHFPEWVGRPFLEIYFKDKDKVTDRAALFLVYGIILFLILILAGVLSFEQIIQAISKIAAALKGQ